MQEPSKRRYAGIVICSIILITVLLFALNAIISTDNRTGSMDFPAEHLLATDGEQIDLIAFYGDIFSVSHDGRL